MTAGRALRLTALAAAAAGAFFLLAAADLGLRSREALRRAEREDFWRANPAEKRRHFEALYAAEAAAAGQASAEAASRAAALRAAERDFKISESSAKMAYLWYKTAAEEFSSPLNPWAGAARKKMPGALEAWRAELKAKGVKTEDWMLE